MTSGYKSKKFSPQRDPRESCQLLFSNLQTCAWTQGDRIDETHFNQMAISMGVFAALPVVLK